MSALTPEQLAEGKRLRDQLIAAREDRSGGNALLQDRNRFIREAEAAWRKWLAPHLGSYDQFEVLDSLDELVSLRAQLTAREQERDEAKDQRDEVVQRLRMVQAVADGLERRAEAELSNAAHLERHDDAQSEVHNCKARASRLRSIRDELLATLAPSQPPQTTETRG